MALPLFMGYTDPVNGAPPNSAYNLKVTMCISFGDLLLFCFGSTWGLNSKYHKMNISGG